MGLRDGGETSRRVTGLTVLREQRSTGLKDISITLFSPTQHQINYTNIALRRLPPIKDNKYTPILHNSIQSNNIPITSSHNRLDLNSNNNNNNFYESKFENIASPSKINERIEPESSYYFEQRKKLSNSAKNYWGIFLEINL